MKIKLITVIVIAKLILKICRWFGRGGTSLPGKIALILYPDLLKVFAAEFTVIMVTGTNGKTTTTGIISQILKENGIRHITNKSGANLVSGVVSAFIESIGYAGDFSENTAVIEVDEAAFNAVAKYMEPNILVVTNFFRDQLDRYGELYTTLKKVAEGVGKTIDTRLILNADDSLCASLGNDTGRQVLYYGFSPYMVTDIEAMEEMDAAYCMYCKTKYQYTYRTYDHLGGFFCPGCGYARPCSDITCTRIVGLEDDYSVIEAELPGLQDVCTLYVNTPGRYNIYNALAGIACGHMLGLPVKNTVYAMSKLECGYGRTETVHVSGKRIRLVLVKNPAGMNQVLNSLLKIQDHIQLALAINDRIADGTDVSWLWDAGFEILLHLQDSIDVIYACGTRCEEMALRLKYAGIFTDKVLTINNYGELIKTCLLRMNEGQIFYILATYTAMQDIRKILKGMFGLREVWE